MPQSAKTSQGANADVFTAIAHPVRRQILDQLSEREFSVRELASRFEISRPAISQHLAVLLDVGLVTHHPNGRENIYSLEAARLEEIAVWLRHYERFWNKKLDALGNFLKQNADHET
jgi:DNA-binding transcriptional ArsR family regulator